MIRKRGYRRFFFDITHRRTSAIGIFEKRVTTTITPSICFPIRAPNRSMIIYISEKYLLFRFSIIFIMELSIYIKFLFICRLLVFLIPTSNCWSFLSFNNFARPAIFNVMLTLSKEKFFSRRF